MSFKTTVERCITMVRRLNQGPATRSELIDYVLRIHSREIYGKDIEQAFNHDKSILNSFFKCQIVYDRSTQQYAIEGLGLFGLISLERRELETLAQLRELYRVRSGRKFNGTALPLDQRISRFLQQLVRNLGDYTRAELEAIPVSLRAVGGMVRHQPQLETTLRTLERYQGKRKIAFDYRSLFTVTDPPVRHVVHPFDLIFRDGHFYLVAFMEKNDRNPQYRDQWVDYRVDRIVSDHLTDQGPIGDRPPRPVVTVTYRLHADIAGRQDFKVAIDSVDDEISIQPQSDHSAIVEVKTQMSLFLVRQVLLRYGSRCRVLGPPELVREMRQVTREMSELYNDAPQP